VGGIKANEEKKWEPFQIPQAREGTLGEDTERDKSLIY
jgi:hypothetical protein